MNQPVTVIVKPLKLRWAWAVLLFSVSILAGLMWPARATATIEFVIKSMIEVAPLVIPGILITSWVAASGAGGNIKQALDGSPVIAIVVASMAGSVTPVCGVTVLPLMAGLLASGVPLAPVMAFWLSSPVTDPAMFAVTAATLGLNFAVGKTMAAFFVGLLGGFASSVLSKYSWVQSPLREHGLASGLADQSCCETSTFEFAIWRYQIRRVQFIYELCAITRLITIVLGLAFAAEFLMQQFLAPDSLSKYVGRQSVWAIPLAVFVGSPAYLDGYAALPLTRGLLDHGMSPGAAMAFLVSGSVVSIWGAMAIFPVLKLRPFLLYLILAIAGSLASGYLFELSF